MGKGDKKTRRGKIVNRSYGVRRPKNKNKKAAMAVSTPAKSTTKKSTKTAKKPVEKTAAKVAPKVVEKPVEAVVEKKVDESTNKVDVEPLKESTEASKKTEEESSEK